MTGAGGLTTDEMTGLGQHEEPGLTARNLELFRNEGLMPAVSRRQQIGQRPIYVYPPGAERQLKALISWRRQQRNVDWLRVLMWVDGWPIDISRAGASLTKLLRAMTSEVKRGFDQLVNETANEDTDPIAKAAEQLAGRRKQNSVLPRNLPGTTADGRQRTIESMLRMILDPESGPSVAEQKAMETSIGINPAIAEREGLPAFRNDYSEGGLFGDPPLFNLDRLTSCVETATEEELGRAQRTANLMVVGLPIAAAMMEALGPGKTGSPIDLLTNARDHSALYPVAVALAIAMDRANYLGDVPDLETASQMMIDQSRQLSQIPDMKRSDLERNLKDTPGGLAQIDRALERADLDGITATLDRQGPRGAK